LRPLLVPKKQSLADVGAHRRILVALPGHLDQIAVGLTDRTRLVTARAKEKEIETEIGTTEEITTEITVAAETTTEEVDAITTTEENVIATSVNQTPCTAEVALLASQSLLART